MKQETVNKLPNWDSMIDTRSTVSSHLTSDTLCLTRPEDPSCPPLTGVVVTLPTYEALSQSEDKRPRYTHDHNANDVNDGHSDPIYCLIRQGTTCPPLTSGGNMPGYQAQ